MKKIHLIYAACLLVGMGACAASVQKQVKDNFDVWKEYNTGAVLFEDKAPETLGSDIYHRTLFEVDIEYIPGGGYGGSGGTCSGGQSAAQGEEVG